MFTAGKAGKEYDGVHVLFITFTTDFVTMPEDTPM